jgi:hypothetical protein
MKLPRSNRNIWLQSIIATLRLCIHGLYSFITNYPCWFHPNNIRRPDLGGSKVSGVGLRPFNFFKMGVRIPLGPLCHRGDPAWGGGGSYTGDSLMDE